MFGVDEDARPSCPSPGSMRGPPTTRPCASSPTAALLRGLGRLHVFPQSDVGALNGLRSFLADTGRREDPRSALNRWAPDAGLVYFHLLLRGLELRGHDLARPASLLL
jgi:hypothetical protein